MSNKKYKKQLLKGLKSLAKYEHSLLTTMTNLMLQGELNDSDIHFKKGDTFTFKDNIFNYSENKTIRSMAKIRKKTLKTINQIVENNNFKDKELEFLA
ncbi:hypothetical protein [Frigoriflavimonas asaccharolytica]|uniref:Uncharacterized protein n=1 Tax=Frigoriflavimonas asaccharolytica TaxID=2735899 RepID=A0A8J8KA92_9FLAO|nr:hypothetical protein [Frigoriflavimonas asaccharolytica]NRS91234.1 hypothetical protein [Frigoriflavimonas asaccharolytica]